MNDRRFIELLNLYLDHQINPDEAAELEASVHSTPARRRTYEEYCQLQRGCSQLGSTALASAPIAPRFARSLQDVERKITTPRRFILWYPLQVGGLATLAMAAGFALVVLTHHSPESVPDPLTRNHAFNSVNSGRVLAAASSVVPPKPMPVLTPFTVQPATVAIGLSSAQNVDDMDSASPDRESLEWIQRVDLISRQALVLDEQAFTSTAMVPPDTRVFRRSRSPQTSAEFTGFQLSQ